MHTRDPGTLMHTHAQTGVRPLGGAQGFPAQRGWGLPGRWALTSSRSALPWGASLCRVERTFPQRPQGRGDTAVPRPRGDGRSGTDLVGPCPLLHPSVQPSLCPATYPLLPSFRRCTRRKCCSKRENTGKNHALVSAPGLSICQLHCLSVCHLSIDLSTYLSNLSVCPL